MHEYCCLSSNKKHSTSLSSPLSLSLSEIHFMHKCKCPLGQSVEDEGFYLWEESLAPLSVGLFVCREKNKMWQRAESGRGRKRNVAARIIVQCHLNHMVTFTVNYSPFNCSSARECQVHQAKLSIYLYYPETLFVSLSSTDLIWFVSVFISFSLSLSRWLVEPLCLLSSACHPFFSVFSLPRCTKSYGSPRVSTDSVSRYFCPLFLSPPLHFNACPRGHEARKKQLQPLSRYFTVVVSVSLCSSLSLLLPLVHWMNKYTRKIELPRVVVLSAPSKLYSIRSLFSLLSFFFFSR